MCARFKPVSPLSIKEANIQFIVLNSLQCSKNPKSKITLSHSTIGNGKMNLLLCLRTNLYEAANLLPQGVEYQQQILNNGICVRLRLSENTGPFSAFNTGRGVFQICVHSTNKCNNCAIEFLAINAN